MQNTTPVNLDGQYSLRSFMTYGFPVASLKSNLNIDLVANYTRTPGVIEENLNFASNTTTGAGLTLASNVSERLDFTVSSRSNYNFVGNTLESTISNDFFNQKTKLKLNWILGDGLVFRTDVTHDYYSGLEESFDQNVLLWNLSIGQKLFKDDRGEISLTVFDLLNQNQGISRRAETNFLEERQSLVLTRFFMLSFNYRIAKVGGENQGAFQITTR